MVSVPNISFVVALTFETAMLAVAPLDVVLYFNLAKVWLPPRFSALEGMFIVHPVADK